MKQRSTDQNDRVITFILCQNLKWKPRWKGRFRLFCASFFATLHLEKKNFILFSPLLLSKTIWWLRRDNFFLSRPCFYLFPFLSAVSSLQSLHEILLCSSSPCESKVFPQRDSLQTTGNKTLQIFFNLYVVEEWLQSHVMLPIWFFSSLAAFQLGKISISFLTRNIPRIMYHQN